MKTIVMYFVNKKNLHEKGIFIKKLRIFRGEIGQNRAKMGSKWHYIRALKHDC